MATGRGFFSPANLSTLAADCVRELQRKRLEDSYELLTEREREILQLWPEASPKWPRCSTGARIRWRRIAHLMEKPYLHNTAEIVLYAVCRKIIT